MSLFVCAKCGCVDNTATSSYWMLTNEYMVDKFEYAKELQPYKGMGLCSECGRLATSPDGRDVVVPGKWHGKFPKKKATEEQLKKVEYKNIIRQNTSSSKNRKIKNDVIMATKKQILESNELLQQKRKAYHLSDEGFEEYKKFLSDPDQKKFCFKGYYYVEVKEQDDKELSGLMGRVVYK